MNIIQYDCVIVCNKKSSSFIYILIHLYIQAALIYVAQNHGFSKAQNSKLHVFLLKLHLKIIININQ